MTNEEKMIRAVEDYVRIAGERYTKYLRMYLPGENNFYRVEEDQNQNFEKVDGALEQQNNLLMSAVGKLGEKIDKIDGVAENSLRIKKGYLEVSNYNAPPGYPNDIDKDPNNYLNKKLFQVMTGNTALTMFSDSSVNAYRVGIQVGNPGSTGPKGTLELMPFGGKVTVNGLNTIAQDIAGGINELSDEIKKNEEETKTSLKEIEKNVGENKKTISTLEDNKIDKINGVAENGFTVKNGCLETSYYSAPPGYPNDIDKDPNNYLNKKLFQVMTGNTALTMFSDSSVNAYRVGIQVGNPGNTGPKGTLELMPFGGKVTVNGLNTIAQDIAGGINELKKEQWTNESCPISKNKNGYCKLYNGMVMQWGTFTINKDGYLAFPISFKGEDSFSFSHLLHAVSIVTHSCNVYITDVSKSGVNLYAVNGSGNRIKMDMRWVAIGY